MTLPGLQNEAVTRIEGWLLEERRQRTLCQSGEKLEGVVELEIGRCNYVWNEQGDLVRIVEADGGQAFYEYDDQRRLARARQSDGTVSVFEYDTNDRLLAINSPEQQRKFEYNHDGRPHI